MEDLLIRKNLRWTGHLMRMSPDRLPQQVLYSHLSSGHRKGGRPRLRFKDTIKWNLKLRDIKTDSWTSLSQQRDRWRAIVKGMEAVFVASRPTAWWWLAIYTGHLHSIWLYSYHQYIVPQCIVSRHWTPCQIPQQWRQQYDLVMPWHPLCHFNLCLSVLAFFNYIQRHSVCYPHLVWVKVG